MSVAEFISWGGAILGAAAGVWGHAVYSRADNSDARQTLSSVMRVAGPIVALALSTIAVAIRSAQ